MTRGKFSDALSSPCVAVVGARKCSENSRSVAFEVASGLASKGFTVVSGMAHGVDAAAHLGAIEGGGDTVAVFGAGIDVVYPPAHRGLLRKIEDAGVAVSEFPLGQTPMPCLFPQRNRIISGLSLACVVVEAAAKSGSLITARMALEQGRDVMSVPGPGGNISSRGSNTLIRDGAMLVECSDDVVSIVQRLAAKRSFPKKSGHFEVDMGKGSKILGLIPKNGAISIDSIVSSSRLGVVEVGCELSRLVLAGKVEELWGRRFRLKERR
jgi:DNA processing protein